VTTELAPPPAVADPAQQRQRLARFDDDVKVLRVGGASIHLSERILLVVAGVVAPLGLVLVLLGYLGASRTPYLFEQVSYLISGGLFGLALVFLGSFFYFAHWITQLVKEHRVQSTAVLEALQRLQEEVARQGPAPPASPSANGHRLVATARGTMAHRADCPADPATASPPASSAMPDTASRSHPWCGGRPPQPG
jgi:hypothetical protein